VWWDGTIQTRYESDEIATITTLIATRIVISIGTKAQCRDNWMTMFVVTWFFVDMPEEIVQT